MMTRKTKLFRMLCLALLCAGVGLGLLSGGHEAAAQKMITVCAEGCDFAKIQQAIDAAAAGDTVDVKAGMYVENLTIRNKQDLTLLGAGRDQVTLDGSAGVITQKPGVLIERSKNITIRGITIVKSRRGVHATDTTKLVIADSGFKENIRQGVYMQRSKAQLTGNLIQDTQPDRSDRGGAHGQGINLNPGEAVIVGNTISGNWHFGLLGQGGSKLTIQKNTISGNGSGGKGVDDGGGQVGGIGLLSRGTTAAIEDNTIADNRMFGVFLADPAVATLAQNRIIGTKKDADGKNGIGLFTESKATLEDVSITGSEASGIQTTDFATVTIHKSTVSDNGFHGVYATVSASVTIKQTTISGNKETGIQLGATDVADETVQAEVSGNTVQNNGTCGVFADIDSSISSTSQGNTISGNAGGNLCGYLSKFPTGFGGGK